MLFWIALVLLALWLIGMLGVYNIGDFVHVLLLVGFMLPLAFLRARDAAARRAVGGGPADRVTDSRSKVVRLILDNSLLLLAEPLRVLYGRTLPGTATTRSRIRCTSGQRR